MSLHHPTGGGPTSASLAGAEALLTPREVAAMFRGDPKTVNRWAVAGRLEAIRTPGGRCRYRHSQVRALLADDTDPEVTDGR